ncbi:hypothetical protein [Pelodictyon luteolum]|uniref:Uncharacterized protein n=1 Tax=Chlorobium luteolum (strain DSM 273 / BCRC 81028 / 2530) TaxID=319225 RepID=Q3B1R3_CHLL3|nr:hypothetical protein [Pelodictyon luteolum]ABB24718.1 hypothetical protein Plut_1870 [Pelodictyon luteolum DSM 273]
MMPRNLPSLELRISGPHDEPMVDAEVLSAALQGFQRAVFVLAMDARNEQSVSSGYIPKAIQKMFPVRCWIPTAGSYQLPMTVGSYTEAGSIEEVTPVIETLHDCLRGLHDSEDQPFLKVRNPHYRLRLLNAFQTLVPKAGQPWKLAISGPGQPVVSLSGVDVGKINTIRERLRHQERVSQTITGYLQAMEFAGRRITILYPENNRELECVYDVDWEPELLAARRGLVQVTGTVSVDAGDLPVRIHDVESIEPLDMSDFEVSEVEYPGGKLSIDPPLVLSPELTESSQYLMLLDEQWNIEVIAATREQLLSELQEQVVANWIEYGKEDDAMLTEGARNVKRLMRDRIKE